MWWVDTLPRHSEACACFRVQLDYHRHCPAFHIQGLLSLADSAMNIIKDAVTYILVQQMSGACL